MTGPEETRPRHRFGLRPKAADRAGRGRGRMSREELEAEASAELERAAASGEPPEVARRAPPPPSSEIGMHRRYRFQYEYPPRVVEAADIP